jgi:AcrR family transcriptional regulator
MTADERREAIITAAVRLFAEKGFRGTTTREIASAVGVSEPVLYNHFATKSDLYSAIIDRKSQEGKRKVEAVLLPSMESNDDHAVLLEMARLVVAWYEDDPAYIRLLLYSALESHELATLSYERQAVTFFQMVAGYFRRRIDAGAFRPVDDLVAARAFIGMVAHYALGTTIFKCDLLKAPAEENIARMVDLFLTGICSEQKG